MRFKTSITTIKNGQEIIRGKDLNDWVKSGKTFAETIFLLLRGKEPTENETKMMDALFSIAIDHGPGTVSAQVARIAASANSELHVSVAAGILAMGERHGGAIESAARIFQEPFDKKDVPEMVKDFKVLKMRVPGFGHSILEHDERSDVVFHIAKETGFFGPCCERARAIHAELNRQFSKKLPLNVDGAMAAILSDMGFAPEVIRGVFIIARTPGLVAQVHEEMVNDEGLRRLDESEIDYVS